jgi:hypothetical protein
MPLFRLRRSAFAFDFGGFIRRSPDGTSGRRRTTAQPPLRNFSHFLV